MHTRAAEGTPSSAISNLKGGLFISLHCSESPAATASPEQTHPSCPFFAPGPIAYRHLGDQCRQLLMQSGRATLLKTLVAWLPVCRNGYTM